MRTLKMKTALPVPWAADISKFSKAVEHLVQLLHRAAPDFKVKARQGVGCVFSTMSGCLLTMAGMVG